jgi:nicotinamide-nucleotide amidase
MICASIICVGNELLNGQTVDSNAAYLGRQLFSLGIPVVRIVAVPDDIQRIADTLSLACSDSDVVLVTGGLGPTDDDLTRQGLARFLDCELYENEALIKQVACFFEQRRISMPQRNRIQACLPQGTEGIENTLGTAPGILARQGDAVIVVMPGVPHEMKNMFEQNIVPVLQEIPERACVVMKRLRCFGTGESMIADRLGSMMQRDRNPLINCTVHFGVITLTITARADQQARAEALVEQDVSYLRRELNTLIFGVDDQTLAQVVGQLLTEQKKTIAIAESCTGGLLAQCLTDHAGASRYFNHGLVTYSNEAKITQLSVSPECIAQYGAVSEPVAGAMARGARARAGTDYAIAITGIAGPAGGTPDKPVGLVYICIDSQEDSHTRRFQFTHNREFIRSRSAQTALNMLRLRLLGFD